MPLCIAIDFETSDYAPESACAVGLARVILPEGEACSLPAALGRVDTPEHAGDPAPANGPTRANEPGRIDGVFYSLIRPPSSRVRFTHIHGLTWPMLRDAPRFADLWPEMVAFIRGPGASSGEPDFFVAHNAPFDRKVLHACCARAGLPAPAAPFLCTLKGARRALRLPSHALNAVCAHCGIPLDHHHAESDALAAAALLLHLRATGLGIDAMRAG